MYIVCYILRETFFIKRFLVSIFILIPLFSKNFHYKKQNRDTALGWLALLFLLYMFVFGAHDADAPYGLVAYLEVDGIMTLYIMKIFHK